MTKRAWFWLAVLVSVKPVLALTAALSQPGCLVGANKAGVPHAAPSLAAAVLLGVGWTLWSDRRSFYSLFGWLFLLGSAMFSTVPLYLGLGWRLPEWEWAGLVVVMAVLSVRLSVAMQSKSREYRATAYFGVVVLAVAIFGPLPGALSAAYTAAVCFISFGGLAALVTMLAWLHHHDQRSEP